MRRRRTAALLPLAGLAAFFCLWEAVPRAGLVNPAFLPPPSAVPEAFLRELRSGQWLAAIGGSLGHYLLGLGLGIGLGLAAGTLTGLFRTAEGLTAWVVRVLRPVPGLAWVPFAIIWFGVSPAAAVFIVAVGVFWIVYFASHGAIRGVDRDLVELAEAFGFRSAPERLVKVVWPAAVPGILVGVRTAIGQAWMAVVAAEIFGVAGLGQRMMQASTLLATEIVVVYMLTMALLYGVFDAAFTALQRRMLRWRA
ncbi:ABC transporter permease [Methylobacterium oryzihabitans]|uniref:ABC transporter permease n=1 Tax=Methylobacterium oryzihabitans TaxID=2499852 RepID=A0A437P3E4_9HYPH|nr:ABC transporter permease [Methylobacterium oryzihabitans]RVU16819.1 ABC transporter permease [Methylobacterium oryzihabitans]